MSVIKIMSPLIVPGGQNIWIGRVKDLMHLKCNVLSKSSSAYWQKNFIKILATVRYMYFFQYFFCSYLISIEGNKFELILYVLCKLGSLKY